MVTRAYAGALMAIEYINRDSNILGDYQLDLLVEDTECKVDVAMKHFLHYAVDGEHPVVAILGKCFMFVLSDCEAVFELVNSAGFVSAS